MLGTASMFSVVSSSSSNSSTCFVFIWPILDFHEVVPFSVADVTKSRRCSSLLQSPCFLSAADLAPAGLVEMTEGCPVRAMLLEPFVGRLGGARLPDVSRQKHQTVLRIVKSDER